MAGADDVTLDEDSPATPLDLLGNDSDADGDTLVVVSTTGAAKGTVSLSGGQVTYTPDADAYGSDAFSYTVSDGTGRTADAAVDVTVAPQPDAPVAGDDTLSVDEDDPATPVDVLAGDTDADGDTLSVSSVGAAAHGSVALSGGTVTYAPDADYDGPDSFSYTADDGTGRTSSATVTVTVSPVEDAPVAADDAYSVQVGDPVAGSVLDNDSDEDGDALTVVSDDSPDLDVAADGTFSWTPSAPGSTTFTYVVDDGTLTTTGTVTITATAAPPTSQSLYLRGGDTLSVGVLSPTAPLSAPTDWDGDGDPGLTIKHGDMKVTELDVRKFQLWSYPVGAGGLALDGPVQLRLWSSPELKADKAVDYAVWVDDCDALGLTCVPVVSSVKVHVDDWTTTTTWEQRTITVGSAQHTVAAGRQLRLRLMFGHEDLWLPLDAAHPSELLLGTG
ncbi:cadherin-like domain-containing protein [Angustibacter peucedani]